MNELVLYHVNNDKDSQMWNYLILYIFWALHNNVKKIIPLGVWRGHGEDLT